MKYHPILQVTALLFMSVTVFAADQKAPEYAFKSEKTGTFVAKLSNGTCVVALKSNTGIAIAHEHDRTTVTGGKDGIWLFTLSQASLLKSAVGKFSDGSEKKIVLDREHDLVKIILFEKELKANKNFTLSIDATNGRTSSHVYDLSDFVEAQKTADNGCKPVAGIWNSIKRKVAGGE